MMAKGAKGVYVSSKCPGEDRAVGDSRNSPEGGEVLEVCRDGVMGDEVAVMEGEGLS